MQTPFQTFLLPLAAAAILVLTGCASSKDRTVGRTIDDRMVKGKVEDALKEEPVYKFEDVRVSTYNGIVQLSGWANSEEQKARAAEIASKVEGVHEVVNNISLKLAPTGYPGGYPPRGDTNNAPRKVDAPIRTPESRGTDNGS
jgi:hypothetical protein